MAKRLTDEEIITALMLQGSVTKAAEKLGCQRRTLHQRMKKQSFQDLYAQARSEQLKAAAAKLQRYSNSAIDTVCKIMIDQESAPQTRLNAAQAILSYSLKLTEQVDIVDRLERLEKEVNNEHT